MGLKEVFGSKEIRYKLDCLYSVEKKVWVPFDLKKRCSFKESLRYALIVLLKSPGAFARCRKCGVNFTKGELRIGYPIQDPRGDFEVISAWLHMKCSIGIVENINRQFVQSEKQVYHDWTKTPKDQVLALEFPCKTGEARRTAIHGFLCLFAAGYDDLSTEEQQAAVDALAVTNAAAASESDEVDLDDLVKKEIHVSAETPAEMLVPLLNFQKQGLAWMCQQEESDTAGGILADEMGMGKTIQVIALMLSRKVKGAVGKTTQENMSTSSNGDNSKVEEGSKKGGKKKSNQSEPRAYDGNMEGANLVVAPLAAVLQWKSEIEKFAKPNALKVMVYHGHSRKALMSALAETDVVITTYSTIEAEFRACVNRQKLQCDYCGKMYLADKLKVHLRYICGPNARKTDKQAKQEKKNDNNSMAKALKSLGIGSTTAEAENKPFVPTIKNVYKELMLEAGRFAEAESMSAAPWLGRPIKKQSPEPDDDAGGDLHTKREETTTHTQDEDKEPGQETVSKGTSSRTESRRTSSNESAVPKSTKPLAARRRSLSMTAGEREDRVSKRRKVETQQATGRERSLSVTSSGKEDQDQHEGRRGGRHEGRVTKKRNTAVLFTEEEGPSSKRSGVSSNSSTKDKVSREGQKSARNFRKESRPQRVLRQRTRSSVAPLRQTSDSSSDSLPEYSDSEYQSSSSAVESSSESEDSTLELEYSSESQPSEAATSFSTEWVDSSRKKRKSGNLGRRGRGGRVAASARRTTSVDEYKTYDEDAVSQETKSNAFEDVDLSSSPLFLVRWNRVILDEAHRIKSRQSSTAKAIFSLDACKYRWCLSGTPLQNRVSELYSLVRFLRHDPYAFYFCSKRGCDCKLWNFRFDPGSKCGMCGHHRILHFSYFNKRVMKPILDYGYIGEGRQALEYLRYEVLDKLLLRRTKVEKAEDVKLPPLEVVIRKDGLTSEEQDFYEALFKQSEVKFNTYVDEGTVLYNYAHIFDILSRLRQAVDHPYLVIHGSLATQQMAAGKALMPSKSRGMSKVCGLCQDDIEKGLEVDSSCKHSFHQMCLENYLAVDTDEGQTLGCPVCFAPLTVDLSLAQEMKSIQSSTSNSNTPELCTSPSSSEPGLPADGKASSLPADSYESLSVKRSKKGPDSILHRIKTSEFQSSTKIEALVQEIDKDFSEDPSCKVIVFSQFVMMLALIEWRLKKSGFGCALLSGNLSMQSRSKILYTFNNDPSLKIIMISLKAGGEGLNLQVANKIYVMDPWWNPASEMQAIQRAHRIGQTKPVKAVRFIASNTVEERILELQAKKQLVFDGTVGQSAGAMAKLTKDDLQFLFTRC